MIEFFINHVKILLRQIGLNKIEMGTAHLANPDREVFRGSALIFDEKGF